MGELVLGIVVTLVMLSALGLSVLASFVALGRSRRLERQVLELEREVQRLRVDRVLGTQPRSGPAESVTSAETISPPVVASGVESAVAPDGAVDQAVSPTVPPTDERPAADGPAPVLPAPQPQAAPRPWARSIAPERMAMWIAAALGGLSVVLASLFALSAAIDRGWIGPATRIGIGLALGTLAWWGGTLARGRRLTRVGSALVGAGVSGICGSLYAGNVLYGVLETPLTFGLLAVVSGVALFSGVRQGSRFDAWLGLVGGLATPLLVQSTEPRPMALFGYLGVLVAGTIAAGARRGWVELVSGATVGFVLFFAAWSTTDARPVDLPVALGVLAALGVACVVAERWMRTDHPRMPTTLALSAVLLAGAAVLWVGPAEAMFVDPRSGLAVFRASPHGAWIAAVGLVAVLAPSVVGLRSGVARLWSGGVAVLLVGVYAWRYSDVPALPLLPVGGMLATVPLLGALRRRDAADELDRAVWLLPIASGLGATLLLDGAEPSVDVVVWLTLPVVVSGAVLALARRSPMVFLPALLGACAPLTVAALMVHEVGPMAVAGPAALALGLFGTLPLLVSSDDPRTTVAAALAGPLLFLPLHRAWDAAGGTHWIGLLPVMLALVSLLGTLTLVRRHRVRRDSGALALFVGVTLLGLTAAIPLQLRDQWLTVAWALEGVAVAWLSRRLGHRLLRWTAVLLGLAVTIRLVVNPFALEYATASGPVLFNWTLYTWGVPALALMSSVWLLGPSADRDRVLVPEWARLVLLLCATAVGFALVNVQVSHAFQDSGPIELGGRGIWQGMVRSLAWAGYGITILAVGTRADHRVIRMVGFCGVLAAAGKVFLSDLWSLSGFVRVGSIAGLGVTLLVAAFVFERLVLRRADDAEGEEA